ncbi:5' nucleotidase, NT5C type [Allohahella marinimesophila]|uniref:Uncharacterized protein n=1 Tax=Allohahella marinimesophila TaxID=1054972 RepID=A0ABP7PVP1_9GAMM
MNSLDQPKIVYLDMDHVLCDYDAAYALSRECYPELQYPQSRRGYFSELQPMPGAVQAYHRLRQTDGLSVFILTAPSVRNPHCYSEKRLWIENHLGLEAAYRLIISPDKSLLKGDYLVDDKVRGRGQEHFGGCLLQFGSPQFPTWSAILAFFEQDLFPEIK